MISKARTLSSAGKHSRFPALKHFLIAFLIALALCTEFGEFIEVPESGISNAILQALYKLNYTLYISYEGKGFAILALTCLFLFIPRPEKRKPGCARPLAVFFAIMYTAGRAFDYGNSLSVLFSPSINLLKTLILLLGYGFLFHLFICAVYYLVCGSDKSTENRFAVGIKKVSGWADRTAGRITVKCGAFYRAYQKHSFTFLFCVIFLFWLPHILLRYPGAMSYDNWNEAAYYLGYKTYTTAQPVVHTWLFGSFLKLGMTLGSANLGIFLFVLLQSCIMALVLAITQLDMKRWHTPAWIRIFFLLVYLFTPYYTGYAAFPIKDYLFTAGFLLWISAILNGFLALSGHGVITYKDFSIRWLAGSFLMLICRNNGIYIYAASLLFFLLSLLIHRRSVTMGSRKFLRYAVTVLLPVVLFFAAESAITAVYDVQQDSPKEMFSLAFQQTARTVRDHGDSISEEDREAIAKVLDYDSLSELYLESSADPVKTTYHAQSGEELIAYLKVWGKEFFEHPVCYLEATWNQCYTLFLPDHDDPVFNQDAMYGAEILDGSQNMAELTGVSIPSALQGVAAWLCSFYKLQISLPITGRINNVAVNVMLLFILTALLRYAVRKQRKCKSSGAGYVTSLGCLPFWFIFLFVILGPQVASQPRYSFPIIYGIPILFAYVRKSYSIIKENGME